MSVESGGSGGGAGAGVGSGGGVGGGIGVGISMGPSIGIGSGLGGIEGGGPGGAAPVSGLARFDSGPAFGATPAVAKSGLAGLGPALEAPVNSTFSDRTAVSLEGFKSMGVADLVAPPSAGGAFKQIPELNPVGSTGNFSPAGEVMFNQKPVNATSPLGAADVLSGVESILSRTRINLVQEQVSLPEIDVVTEVYPWSGQAGSVKNEVAPEPKIIKEAAYWFTDVEPKVVKKAEIVRLRAESAVVPLVVPDIQGYPRPQIGISPALEPITKTENALGIQTVRQIATGSATSVETAPAVSTQPATQKQEVEEVMEEIIQEKTDMVEEEEIEQIRRKYVVDERALSQVVAEVKQAVVQAKELANKLGIRMTGKLIGMFVPGQHEGNESEVVKGVGPDGSIPARQQSIESLGEFFSEVQAEEEVIREAYEKPPVKIRPEGQGQPVKDEDVARVFRHRTVKLIEKAYEEVVRRVIKKKLVSVSRPVMAPALVSEKKEVKTEQTLEELNPQLAGVFQKAV